MPIYLRSGEELARMREVGLIVCDVLDAVGEECRPGVSTADLNDVTRRVMTRANATSAFLGYAPRDAPPYPAVLCTSINQVVVHGIPRKDEILEEGDVIGIDFACYRNGFCTDSARTIGVGQVSDAAVRLLAVTRDSLDRAIAVCTPEHRLQDIGWAVQEHVEKNGFAVVSAFCGHGIGKAMHEEPSVPNQGTPGRGLRLKPGMVFAIEPMVTQGSAEVEVLEDGWTAAAAAGPCTAPAPEFTDRVLSALDAMRQLPLYSLHSGVHCGPTIAGRSRPKGVRKCS